MQFDAGLIGDAATLAHEHKALLERLPATVHAFIAVELQKWPTLFDAERRYQRALLEHLSRLSSTELLQNVAGITRVEAEAGLNASGGGDPGRFQDQAQALLRKRRLVPEWRREVDRFFQTVGPMVDAQLYPADAPRRLIVQVYGSDIAIQPDKLWSRFKGSGIRVPLASEATQGAGDFLTALFGGPGAALFRAARDLADFAPLDAWIIESHEALHDLCEERTAPGRSGGSVTGLSYDRLREYRNNLSRALYSKILSGVENPQAFAAYVRSLKIAPDTGALPNSADVLQAFVRDVLLTGNGTLFVNNTFVEWAAVQAIRRAQPRVLVTRFGVRDKLKPFSSLLLFSQPRPSDQLPVKDPAGSFIDVEQLSYYVWLNAEKSPAYRNRTLYLFLAEGASEMLAIRSGAPASTATVLPAASLSDVCATMAQWLGVPGSELSGRPIAALVQSG
jgi:hypothetical protein